MRRLVLFTAVLLAILAVPASAATRISWTAYQGPFEPWGPQEHHILLAGDSGANHDITISASGAQQIFGYPQYVDVYDYGDTFEPGAASPDYPNPCRIFSAHHAACITDGPPAVPGDSYSYPNLASIEVDTGDGNDSVTFNDKLNPLVVAVDTGAGNDTVDVEGAWPCKEYLGAGDDSATFGTIPPVGPPTQPCLSNWWVYGQDGNDSINTLNGSQDRVFCGRGTDSLTADPIDEGQYDYPSSTDADCEQRTPPVG